MSKLYPHLLGDAFHQLAPMLQRFHTEMELPWHGKVQVIWNPRPALRQFLKLGGLPRETASQPITVCVTEANNSEIWKRQFGKQVMASRQKISKDSIQEGFGPVALILDTFVDKGALIQTCLRSRLLGIPLPRPLEFRVTAREWEQDECFHFDVGIAWANVSLIRYVGWLRPQPLSTSWARSNNAV